MSYPKLFYRILSAAVGLGTGAGRVWRKRANSRLSILVFYLSQEYILFIEKSEACFSLVYQQEVIWPARPLTSSHTNSQKRS